MRAYVTTSGTMFALLVIAHIWRVALEGWSVALDPFFVVSTLVAGALAAWAWRVLRTARLSSPEPAPRP